jgi:hypothetical protein
VHWMTSCDIFCAVSLPSYVRNFNCKEWENGLLPLPPPNPVFLTAPSNRGRLLSQFWSNLFLRKTKFNLFKVITKQKSTFTKQLFIVFQVNYLEGALCIPVVVLFSFKIKCLILYLQASKAFSCFLPQSNTRYSSNQ